MGVSAVDARTVRCMNLDELAHGGNAAPDSLASCTDAPNEICGTVDVGR
jgi:hypothetical protein